MSPVGFSSYVSGYAHVFLYKQMQVSSGEVLQVYLCRGQRTSHDGSSGASHLGFGLFPFETGPLTGLEFTEQAQVAGQSTPGTACLGLLSPEITGSCHCAWHFLFLFC